MFAKLGSILQIKTQMIEYGFKTPYKNICRIIATPIF